MKSEPHCRVLRLGGLSKSEPLIDAKEDSGV